MVNWITSSQNSGNGTTILTITAATNSELTARTAALVVSSATLTASTTVSQLGRDAVYVTVIPNTLSFGHSSGSSVVRIESNGAWTVSASPTTLSWLSLNTTAGTGNGVIQVSVSDNMQTQPLSGTIRVSTADDYKDISVTQAGYTWVSADTQSLSYPSSVGGGYTWNVYVSSNGSWTAECPSWITATYTAYTGSRSVGFKVTENNTGFDERVGYIRLITDDDEFVITATQDAALMTLSVSPSGTTRFEYTGETVVFTATTNGYWTISEKPSWLTLSQMEGGSGTTLISATSQPNTTYANKYGDLVFVNDDNTITIPCISRYFVGVTVNYNIVSGGNDTRIVNEYQDFESISIDGGPFQPITSCWIDIATGQHTIVFRLTGDTISGGAWIYQYGYPTITQILGMRSDLVTAVTISAGVRSISGGFAGQMYLTDVTFEQGSRLEEIGFSTFEYCYRLTSIDIPTTVQTIGSAAFRFSGLDSISIPDSVTNQGVSANSVFASCYYLKSAYVPDIDYTKGWFADCPMLTGATYMGIGENTNGMFSGSTALTTVYMPNVTVLGDEIFRSCTALETYDIGSGVTSIGYESFSGCTSLSSVTTYSSGLNIKTVGNCAFQDCSALTSIDLMQSKISGPLTSTFFNCSSLQSVSLPGTLTSLGNWTFCNCTSLNEITWLSTTAPSYESGTFANVPAGGTLYVPNGFESNYSTLANAIQWNVQPYIPTDFIVVEDEVSYLYCETGVSKTIQVFSPNQYYTVSINSADFSVSGTPAVGYKVFNVSSNITNTGSTDVTATLTFTRIGSGAEYPVTLRVLTSDEGYDLSVDYVLPNSGTQTINRGGSGKMIIDDTLMPLSTSYTFGSSGDHNVKYVFDDKTIPNSFLENSYHTGYTATAVSITIGDEVTSIGINAFHDCTELTGTIVTPTALTEIKDYAFYNTAFEHIIMSADTLNCGVYCFAYCGSLQSVEYKPNALQGGYSNGLFYNSSALTSVTFATNIQSVGNYAFYRCSGLTKLDIPATCNYFGTGIIDYSGIKTIRCYGTTSPRKANAVGSYPFTSGAIQTNGKLYRPSNGTGYGYNSSMSNSEKTWRYLVTTPGSWSIYSL